MTNQPTIDPALRANLAELAELAREIGAEEVYIIREPIAGNISFDFRQAPFAFINAKASLLVVLRFPQSDGGAAGVEVK